MVVMATICQLITQYHKKEVGQFLPMLIINSNCNSHHDNYVSLFIYNNDADGNGMLKAVIFDHPANMRRCPNVGLLLGQRRRRWANSKPALGQRLMFAGHLLGKILKS